MTHIVGETWFYPKIWSSPTYLGHLSFKKYHFWKISVFLRKKAENRDSRKCTFKCLYDLDSWGNIICGVKYMFPHISESSRFIKVLFLTFKKFGSWAAKLSWQWMYPPEKFGSWAAKFFLNFLEWGQNAKKNSNSDVKGYS